LPKSAIFVASEAVFGADIARLFAILTYECQILMQETSNLAQESQLARLIQLYEVVRNLRFGRWVEFDDWQSVQSRL
jgi:hypothetical protein